MCRAFKQSPRPDFYLRQWLLTHAGGTGAGSEDMRTLYAAYHAVRLQQCFLRMVVPKVERRIEGTIQNSRFQKRRACAGSYALWMHLCKNDGVPWQPGDIDIFLETEADMKMTLKLYEDIIGTIANIEVYGTSNQIGSFGKANTGKSDSEDDTSAEQYETIDKNTVMDPKLLHTYLPNGLNRVRSKLENNSVWLDVLHSVAEHLPNTMVAQTYTIAATRIINAWVTRNSIYHRLGCFRKINLIQIDVAGAHDFPIRVCDGFDQEQCCFFLEVDDELVSHCTPVGNASVCAGTQKIELRPSCFTMQLAGTPVDAIERQLWRIIKYRRRGFSW